MHNNLQHLHFKKLYTHMTLEILLRQLFVSNWLLLFLLGIFSAVLIRNMRPKKISDPHILDDYLYEIPVFFSAQDLPKTPYVLGCVIVCGVHMIFFRYEISLLTYVSMHGFILVGVYMLLRKIAWFFSLHSRAENMFFVLLVLGMMSIVKIFFL
ncbi:MAG: hypothetical protein LRY46_03115 [Candidatus Pacebacteria bacterium]|nr:hypothetical protein [Candidatus Paceibacterota bacterium]